MRATFVSTEVSTWFLLRKPGSTIEARQPQGKALAPLYHGASDEFGLVMMYNTSQ